MGKIRDFIKKHPKKIFGLTGLAIVGSIGWGLFSYYRPHIAYDKNEFFLFDRNWRVSEFYNANKDGTEKYYRWGSNRIIRWSEKTGDEKIEEIHETAHLENFDHPINLHIEGREKYLSLSEYGEMKMREIRKKYQQHIPFEKILDKIKDSK